jgi:carbon-monoxide dehydrogenase small subunit
MEGGRDKVTNTNRATEQVIPIHVTVNGQAHELLVAPHETLIELIRDRLGLTGTKKSCDVQVCGACTVLLDGRPVSACTLLAFEARHASVLTIEGMAPGRRSTPFKPPLSSTVAFSAAFAPPA